MKRSFKGFLACLLALMLVLPAFSGVLAKTVELGQELGGRVKVETTVTANLANLGERAAVQSMRTSAIDLSGIRNGRTFAAAQVEEENTVQPNDIVSIIVELEAAPAVDVMSDLRSANADSYRAELLESQKKAVKSIASELGVSIEVTHNYSVLVNGFAFDGEYRLVDEINALDGFTAYVAPHWDEPQLFNTVDQVGAVQAWAQGYTGKGQTVAICDTGAVVNHPAFSVNPDEATVQFTRDDIAEIISRGQLHGTGTATMNVNNVYVSGKIPFQWNYYYNRADASHPGNSDHGTHVAGIAAGNNDVIKGVAPDAQIAVMQVFAPSGGASWTNMIPALEDCVILGVAAANFSLGSPNGTENTPYTETLERVLNAGVSLAMSAGNEGDATMNNAWGGNPGGAASFTNRGYALASNPDNGLVGSPSTWPQSLSVGAVQNTKSKAFYFTVEGQNYSYSENGSNPAKLAVALGGQSVEYVMIPGAGEPADYDGLNVTGKVAVVQRGSINFVDKAANAEAKGAVACIVYNNTDGTVNMTNYEGNIPHVFITLEAGRALAAAENKTMIVGTEEGIFDDPLGNMTTSFSSRGLPATMGLKPEITAPGGSIYSSTSQAISGTLYDTWDGTSMSAPHIAGGMAVVKSYVQDNFPNATPAEQQKLVNQILMSTATPILSGSGDYGPVHEQGAGTLNVIGAVTTKAYLSVEGTKGNRPKLELGDDPAKTGKIEMTFKAHNFGTSAITYTVNPVVLLNDLAQLGNMADGTPIIVYSGDTWNIAESVSEQTLIGDANGDGSITIADAILIARIAMGLITLEVNCDLNGDGRILIEDAILAARVAMGLVDPIYEADGETTYTTFEMPETVTVPAGGETTVEVKVQLTADAKEHINEYYPSGALIEGFIELIPENETDVTLSVPFIRYFGDWNYAATIDRGYYYEDESAQWNSNNYPNTIGFKKMNAIYGLGINPYVETADLSYYLVDRNAISPNNDGNMDTVNVVYTGLLRNSNVRYLVLDQNGAQLEQISNVGVIAKGYYNSNQGRREQLGVTQGVFPGGINFAQYGKDEIIIRVEAKLDNDGTHTTNAATLENNENSIWDTPVTIDTTLPTVANFSSADGKFTFDVSDNHYVAYAAVYAANGEHLGDKISEIGIFENERGKTTSVTLDAASGNAYVIVADYAMNEQVYLWDGSTLTPVDAVTPEPFVQPEVSFYCYGKNYNTKAWASFSSMAVTGNATHGAGGGVDDGDYNAGTYTGEYVYAANATSLVRFDASNITAWTDKTTIALSGCGTLTEMAYDRSTGKLYGIELAGDMYEINTTTGVATKACSPANGAVAIDFAPDGTCYVVDVFGTLCTINPTTGAVISEIGNYGVSPVNLSTGSFIPQCGTYSDGCFFWFAAPAGVQYYADMHLYALDVENGANYVDLGSPGGGLYTLALFAYNYVPGEASVEPIDFYDNFDGPFNWEIIDSDGDGLNWETKYFNTGLYHDGAKCAVSYSYTQEQGIIHPDNWMVSPEFSIGGGSRYLSFFTATENPIDGDIAEHFQVLVIPQGTAVEDGVVVYEHTLETNACEEHLVDLSAYAGQTVRIAFRHFDCFDQYTLIIDAVGVGTRK